MISACRALLDEASQHVTPQAIADYCLSDPGYANYVREFSAILTSSVPPAASNFDIAETISLTRWTEAEEMADPARFRRFRIWVNAVGLCIACAPEGPTDMPPNYLAISLLDDAHALQDTSLLRLLSPAFAEFHQCLETSPHEEEAAFITLAQLMLTFLGFGPATEVTALCERLMAEADLSAGQVTPEFLWGCTFFNQLRHRWRHFIHLSFPSDGADVLVGVLRDALLLA